MIKRATKSHDMELQSSYLKFRRKSIEEKLDLVATDDPFIQYCLAKCAEKRIRIALVTSATRIHLGAALILAKDNEPEVLIGLMNKGLSERVEKKLYPHIAKVLIAEIRHTVSRRDRVGITGLLRVANTFNAPFKNHTIRQDLRRR